MKRHAVFQKIFIAVVIFYCCYIPSRLLIEYIFGTCSLFYYMDFIVPFLITFNSEGILSDIKRLGINTPAFLEPYI